MIHHVSISARNPKHVAEVLAELMDGRCFPVSGSIPGCFMAVSGDEHGTMVEVYPVNPTTEASDGRAPETAPFRFLLSLPYGWETIERVGAREGWRTQMHSRGAPGQPSMFNVVELWIENRLMIELAPEEMLDSYIDLFQMPVLERFFGRKAA